MSERTFSITMGEDERLMTLTALGFATTHLPIGEPLALINGLVAKLSRAAGQDTAPAPKQSVQQSPRDTFQLDRKGNEQTTPPEGAELRTVKFLQATSVPGKAGGKPYLKVVFSNGTANCFDSRLWPGIRSTPPNMDISLWLVESGNYLNVVGVRA